jgi:hypothetical protein
MVGGKVTSFSLPGKQQEYEKRLAAAQQAMALYDKALITLPEARKMLDGGMDMEKSRWG